MTSQPELPVDAVRPTTTLAVYRDDYANVYHTMSDLYNVFVVSMFLDVQLSSVEVLLVDAHPSGPLDGVWNSLFGGSRVMRLSQLRRNKTMFRDMIWVTPGHRGLFERHGLQRLPFGEEFRRYK